MRAAVTPILAPDSEAMQRQLEHVFHGDLDGAHDGLIELAWNDPKTGALSAAELFGTDRIDDLVDRAVALNGTPGVNVYVGAALRQPQTATNRRAADADFFAASCIWADVDTDVVAPAIATCKRRGVPPTMTVVTGRHPHLRAQMWWRLNVPCRDAGELRRLCATVASAIGGDPTVLNPSRVLRLGGSVAWPTKDGRVLERTEVHVPRDGRPVEYFIEQITRAFAPEPGPLMTASVGAAPDEIPATQSPPDGGLAIGSLSVEAAVAAVRRGHRWHDHVVRLVAHWIARSWSDAEILATAEGLTLPGWTHNDTRRDLARMIAGARRKWSIPNPVHEVGDEIPPSPIEPRWVEKLDAAMIPRRRWLLGRSLLRGHLTVEVAPPGAGKSTLSIEQAVAVATGREITGQTVHETAKTWVWNNEDDSDELRRRLAAVLQHWSIPIEEIRGRIALNSGADRALMVARAAKDGSAVRTPDVDALVERIRADAVGLLVVDPFAEVHAVEENDNARVREVAALFREVARRGDCAVLLIHHTSKPAAASSDAFAGNQNAARGASSLTGVARVVQTLFAMSERDADKLGVIDHDRRLWVRLDDAKANLSLIDGEAQWFKRIGVVIPNEDEVGVLVAGHPGPPESTETDEETETAVTAEIERAWHVGEPYGARPQCGDRFYGRSLARRLGRPARAVNNAVERLMIRGAIEDAIFNTRNKAKGLRLVPFDERRNARKEASDDR
jgi:KaiC/GvpD/RAD55 family RecA-like ATPase